MQKNTVLTLTALVTLLTVPAAYAEETQDNRWYLAPTANFINTAGDRGAQDGWGGGLGIGKIINQHFNLELKGFYQGFDKNPGALGNEWQLAGATADAQYFFSRNAFAPYTVIGIGGMNTRVNGTEAPSFVGEAGAGFTYEVHDNLLLRSDVRYRYNNNFDTTFGRSTDEFHDMVVNVGVVIPLGAKPSAVKLTIPTPAVPTPVAAATDCATVDSDADGVNDCVDQCPNTLANSKVDAQGCSVSLELKGVNFKYDSAELTDTALHILDTVALSLINYPQHNAIEVRGHTSSEGSNAHNMKLSQKRSQSVVDYLQIRGVKNHLTAQGYGENQPIADNNTAMGKELNRRVELIWSAN